MERPWGSSIQTGQMRLFDLNETDGPMRTWAHIEPH